MKSMVGSILHLPHDSIREYGEVINVKRKFSQLYEVEYKYLDDRIKCTCAFDASVYDGDIYQMWLIGGPGGHWVKGDKLEIVTSNNPIQLALF
jgi:hypothetical protein